MQSCKQAQCSAVSHSLAPNIINIHNIHSAFFWGGGLHCLLNANIMPTELMLIYNDKRTWASSENNIFYQKEQNPICLHTFSLEGDMTKSSHCLG